MYQIKSTTNLFERSSKWDRDVAKRVDDIRAAQVPVKIS